MKLLKLILIYIVVVTVSSLYTSCSKQIPDDAVVNSLPANSATVQVFNATVKAKGNYVYMDGKPVSGSALAFGGVFPGISYGFIVKQGVHSFLIQDTTPTTTQVPLTFSKKIDGGKSYTIFTYDTITSVKQLTVLNNTTVPNDTTCMLRFANFVYSASNIVNLDVYSFKRGSTAPVFSHVATTGVTDFIPYAAGQTDTLYIYETGTTSPLLGKALIPSLTQTRSYTSTLSGSISSGKLTLSTFATY